MLKIEQLHTTGGGWQDQVGGIANGSKLITLESDTQEVRWQTIPITAEFREEIEKRLVLVYTGKTRLAKDLLQVSPFSKNPQLPTRFLDRHFELAAERLPHVGRI